MSRTLQELRDQAVVNCEFFRETIQSTGTAAMTMSVVGTPKFSRVGKTVGLEQVAAGAGVTSGVVAPVVDVTGTMTVEAAVIIKSRAGGYHPILCQSSGAAAGGFLFQDNPADARMMLIFVNGGALARGVSAPIGSTPTFAPLHSVIVSTGGGTGGSVWLDGISTVATLLWAGAAVNSANDVVVAGGAPNGWTGSSGLQTTLLVRAWQGALDAAEVGLLTETTSRSS